MTGNKVIEASGTLAALAAAAARNVRACCDDAAKTGETLTVYVAKVDDLVALDHAPSIAIADAEAGEPH
ncbi:MAG: hypothetical protein QOF42_3019 [Gammaproteobacteria bacterium]|jgi:hypothetical protein|nr:hypothetical protein [Gammaproteobacteria bacterium]